MIERQKKQLRSEKKIISYEKKKIQEKIKKLKKERKVLVFDLKRMDDRKYWCLDEARELLVQKEMDKFSAQIRRIDEQLTDLQEAYDKEQAEFQALHKKLVELQKLRKKRIKRYYNPWKNR
jgi:predicted  nucleic acid-binding Zn-ribbon protein